MPDNKSSWSKTESPEHRLLDLATGVSWSCDVALGSLGNRNSARHVLTLMRDVATRQLQGGRWSPAVVEDQLTVLVVDDNPLVLVTIEHALRNRGHLVIGAPCLEDAVTLFNKVAGIDVIVADVSLGDEDGRDLVGTLRKQDPNLGVVYVTASQETVDGDVLVRKPVCSKELGAAVEAVGRKRRAPVE
jgi:CheY-like chemotaxis protein